MVGILAFGAAFLAAGANEYLCTRWVLHVANYRPARAVATSMASAAFQLIGLGAVFHSPGACIGFVMGYGCGTLLGLRGDKQ